MQESRGNARHRPGAASGARGLALALLTLVILAPLGAVAVATAADPVAEGVLDDTALDPAGEATRIRAELARLELDGAAGEASLSVVRELLSVAAGHAERADALVADATDVEATVAKLERRIADVREKARANAAAEIPADASPGSPGTSPEASLVALGDRRATVDVALERRRAELAALDRRGPEILDALSRARASPVDGEHPARFVAGGGATVDASTNDVVLDTLDAARRLERAGAYRALRRELGTIAPRARIAAARTRLLELQRRELDRLLDATVRSDDAARLAAAEARVAKLEAVQDGGDRDGVDEGDATERPVASASAARTLEHARAAVALAREAAPLRTADAALERERRAVLDARVGTDGVLASGTLGDAEGALLVRLRREMPSSDALRGTLAATERDIAALRLRRTQWQEELRALYAPDGETEAVALLRSLVDDTRRRGERLERRALLLQDTAERAAALATLLDRRLLWLRRTEPFGTGLFADVVSGLRWSSDPEELANATARFVGGVREVPWRTGIPLALAVAGIALRRRIRAAESRLIARVGNVGRDAWWVTPAAIAMIVPLALPLPLAVGAVGWPLLDASAAGSLANALGLASLATATLLFAFGLFRWLSLPGGVFVAHFGWNEAAAAALHRHLWRLASVQVPMTFVLAVALGSGRPELRYGLGLLAFTATSFALGAFAWRLLRPTRGVLALALDAPHPSIRGRLARLLLVAAPVGIGLLPLAGWLDAAIALQAQVFRSILLLLAAGVLYGLLMRLYGVSLRRYTLRWTREQRAVRARSRDAAAAGETVPGVANNDLLAPEPLAGQARAALLAVVIASTLAGLWWLWSPLLPALGVADEIVLWRRVVVRGEESFSTDVTLWSLVLAAGLAIGGILTARNLRGLLQVGLFRRLAVDPGTRYAIITIAGYVVLGAGIVGALAQLGIDWSKLQWIVAALGVGLGFGLQEIVANFVSGLIILFERPVRVGDTVTIGELSGTVSDIRIRATTITDFENREVLLPNKSIITENVTNWTLHDAITRLLLRVGVAYGSDVAEVRALLAGIVRSHPDVLAQPAPTVFFVDHGPSSLDFELRVFVASPAQRLPVTHDLNETINARLAEAGIVIPFPQSDVNLHFSGPGEPDEGLIERFGQLRVAR